LNVLIMAEGNSSCIGIAAVDASDVFNPTTRCVHCNAKNDIAETRCMNCGRDIYDKRKWTIEEEQADMLNAQIPKSSSSNFNLPFSTKIAEADPNSSELIPQNEGREAIPNIDDLVGGDCDDEGFDEPQHGRHIIDFQNLRNLNGPNSSHRPLYTVLCVTYWLYYLAWFIAGSFALCSSWPDVPSAVAVVCLLVPSFILIVVMTGISRLNSVHILDRNHVDNLGKSDQQRHKMRSIVITIALMFAMLLRAMWWIYCMMTWSHLLSHRVVTSLIALSINEFGTVLLINIDYIKMSYFERDRVNHGILGIVEDPFPCLLSLSVLTTVQCWILAYGAVQHPPSPIDIKQDITLYAVCALYVVYPLMAVITISIPIGVVLRRYLSSINNDNHHMINGVAEMHNIEHCLLLTTCSILTICSFMMTFSIFAAFQEYYTWINLLLVPQLLGLLWALIKVRSLSQ